MYARYNLSLSPAWKMGTQGETHRDAAKIKFDVAVDNFMAGGAVDASALEDQWFAQGNYQIFISHSHSDVSLANYLAARLEKAFNLHAFVDSTVWGYADDLLRKIDERFCLFPSGQTFDYSKRNRSTSHVHMMLAAALAKVIDRCECLIFLNTPNSLQTSGGATLPETIAQGRTHTASPWIYYELLVTQLMERRRPRQIQEAVTASFESHLPTFFYRAPTEHLTPLSQTQLERWLQCGEHESKALDQLYKVVSPH